MSRALKFLAPLAVIQLAMPAPAQSALIMVPSCGGTGGMVPLRLPTKDDGGKNQPCCKVCHISMRKRSAADSCCGEEEDPDAA
ncbi:hypothetical protein GGQ88_002043 [Novosphingobium hassiacum]|uniref:Uncharacterized protein n=1 Tax=Novosphingobium hassiacum TaxID=173676 RepID=A0A7W5ZYA4_9SPHN|nr:hypothetical protein [Novosphingobium hassiacum]MBB3860774.1 hypothetical protein [Novosphingobium hassiacum]